MNSSVIIKKFAEVAKGFPNAFINTSWELIFDRQHNIYFRLEDIEDEQTFDCKVLEWLSRPAHKGLPPKAQKRIRDGVNTFFGMDWTVEDMGQIYTRLGNSCNRTLAKAFLQTGLDMSVLNRQEHLDVYVSTVKILPTLETLALSNGCDMGGVNVG